MLEGIVHWPSGDGPFPSVVVCHPHPLYGGDMDNNVVTAVAGDLPTQGIVALRFNFRGVGNSDGNYGDGIGEREDVDAAISFVHSLLKVDANRTAVVGYSFGAFAALAEATNDARVIAAVGISPPITLFDFTFLENYRRPKLLVVGDRDSFAPINQFLTWTAELPEPKQINVVAQASHFWVGHETELSDIVVRFLKPELHVDNSLGQVI